MKTKRLNVMAANSMATRGRRKISRDGRVRNVANNPTRVSVKRSLSEDASGGVILSKQKDVRETGGTWESIYMPGSR
jgi:hypothetical protein